MASCVAAAGRSQISALMMTVTVAGPQQSLPSSPSPGRPHPGLPGPSPSPANTKSTFAAALRDLAKNAGDPASPPGAPAGLPRRADRDRVATPVSSSLPMSSAGPSLPSLPSSLLDVRKVRPGPAQPRKSSCSLQGFGRTTDTRSTPSSPGTVTSDHIAPGGFQPYRSHLGPPPAPPGAPAGPFPPFHPPGLFSSAPGALPGLPPLYG